MQQKPITEMTDEELRQEIERLQAFKLPAAPTSRGPKKTREVKPSSKKARWKDDLGI